MSEQGTPERRHNHSLRQQVDAAYALIAPFFDEAAAWAGQQQDSLALRTLREQMPQLDALEAQVIVSVARRMHRDRHSR